MDIIEKPVEKVSEVNKPSDHVIAYYADEIRDVWLNVGKHEADIAEPVIKSWRSREEGSG